MHLQRFRRYDLLVSLACMALLGSFAWYAYKGPRGYVYRDTLLAEIATLQADNIRLANERAGLEKQVRLMRPEHVDPDKLEELARSTLNMALPHELIVRAQN
jgi:cell division protein FtsB